jgi:hypothetical protein
MDMKRNMLICFFISMLVDKEKEWGTSKSKVGDTYFKSS